ncbi:uncharacterized protein LOC112084525 [Eutrema salsugineum]|uniref:uncharacterized protein LOC112084525 n=1 Tax=Eutrema salsugineum TaxID=72664 RepID=UPI000CED1D0D|nr:uncharacterized protein LOC112084525 [Eutrema salsugineum]
MGLLASRIGKKELLTEVEEALKQQLITDMLSTQLWRFEVHSRRHKKTIDWSCRVHNLLIVTCIGLLHTLDRKDVLGRPGLSALQKCTTAIRLLAYSTAADTVDEYLRLGETTSRKCLEHFVDAIINLFGEEYLRRSTPEDLERLLYVGEQRGFPGMIGSIDCMHWEWKNCPTGWKGQFSRGSGKPTIVLEAVAS